MAIWYSDHYSTDGVARSVRLVPRKLVPAGIGGSALRVTRGFISLPVGTTMVDEELIWMFDLPSHARVHQILANSDGAANSHAANIGIARGAQGQTEGQLIDVNMFSTNLNLGTAWDNVNKLDAPADYLRGASLWEVVNAETTESYSVDPGGTFKVVISNQASADIAGGAVNLSLSAWYTID